jgi:hypothetical protein
MTTVTKLPLVSLKINTYFNLHCGTLERKQFAFLTKASIMA